MVAQINTNYAPSLHPSLPLTLVFFYLHYTASIHFHCTTAIFPLPIGLIPVLTPHPWAYTFGQLQSTNLRGQNVLITGADSGIGFGISRALSHQGASMPMACRNPQLCHHGCFGPQTGAKGSKDAFETQ